jgi:peptidyl-dipeptidase A
MGKTKVGPVLLALVAPLGGCGGGANLAPPAGLAPAVASVVSPAPDASAPPRPTPEQAIAFVADVEGRLRTLWEARDRASWIHENFITDDTEALAAQAEEETADYVRQAIVQSRRFTAIEATLPQDVARKLYLLSIAQTIPAPGDASERSELASLETWLTSQYAKGEYCPPSGSPLVPYAKGPPGKRAAGNADRPPCLHLEQLSHVLATSRRVGELTEAWRSWHAIARPMRAKYTRYVELANEGARDIGQADVGALWRSGYDMAPADLEADVERLWQAVKPLYQALHCYVRSKLRERYGKDAVAEHGPIPAELLGNMWAQQWNNIFDLVVPYPHDAAPDLTLALKARHVSAVSMVRAAESFFTGLGFDPLPLTFWQRSLFARPADREVVCHASAWDVTWSGDLRIKVCIEPTEEDFVTLHHELGHDFYFQRYFKLPILFQQGANDGFHEAIGDTMALSVTREYLVRSGVFGRGADGSWTLLGPSAREHVRINEQMKMALDKVAFLPFGLLIDKWRWDVFAGKVKPADYNASWWRLVLEYQGVAPPTPRTEEDFDPGAKFHVASSTPYLRYFLARIYQFQFHKALCRAAGYSGSLDACSIHDDRQAGAKLKAMLDLGASRPWPDALEVIGAGRQADAGPMLEYFKPLSDWLAEQNRGRSQANLCGWE